MFMPLHIPRIGNPIIISEQPNWNINMFMNMNNFMMNPMGNLDNEPWAQSYTKNSSFMCHGAPDPNKIKIFFKTTDRVETMIIADYGQTMSDVLLLYLKKNEKENLFKRSSGVFFLYNAQMIDIYDETKVEDFFKNDNYPRIIVNEMKFIIGA